ncbi:flavocytochrome c [Enterococcus casseliflavus]|nr:hypothetical protein ECA02_31910 [Enterococcus casseliflavus]STP37345.1 flavocytochrome c [Enterococcus casseliflavus]
MKKSGWSKWVIGAASLLLLSACGADGGTKASSSAASSSSESEVTSGASQQEYTDPAELKDQYDIVIVGAGGAGMAAALSAKDAGMNPVIFRKNADRRRKYLEIFWRNERIRNQIPRSPRH